MPAPDDLQRAAAGLLFPSETDAPLVPFFWPAEKPDALTPEALKTFINAPAGAPVKTVRLDTFFRAATKEEEWHNAEEREVAQRFQALVKAIKATLDDGKVFRVGETAIDVYIVGTVEGGYAGLQTKIVET